MLCVFLLLLSFVVFLHFVECWTLVTNSWFSGPHIHRLRSVLQHFPCRQDEILYVKRISLSNKQMFEFIMTVGRTCGCLSCMRVLVWTSHFVKRLYAAWTNSKSWHRWISFTFRILNIVIWIESKRKLRRAWFSVMQLKWVLVWRIVIALETTKNDRNKAKEKESEGKKRKKWNKTNYVYMFALNRSGKMS